jgi:integrase
MAVGIKQKPNGDFVGSGYVRLDGEGSERKKWGPKVLRLDGRKVRNITEAKEAYQQLRGQEEQRILNEAKFEGGQRITLLELGEWFIKKKAGSVVEVDYTSAWRHLAGFAPHLLEQYIDNVHPADIVDWRNAMDEATVNRNGVKTRRYSRTSINKWTGSIGTAYKEYRKDNLRTYSDLQNIAESKLIGRLKVDNRTRVKKHLTLEQVNSVINAIKAADIEAPYWLSFFLFGVHLGLRPQELLELRFDQFTDDDRIVNIANIGGTAKSIGGLRSLEINDTLKKELAKRRLATGGKGWVFPYYYDPSKPVALDHAHRVFSARFREAGIEDTGTPEKRKIVGSFRHTYAVLNLEAAKLTMQQLSQNMGHSSVTVTQDNYAKWVPGESAAKGAKATEQIFSEVG